jgi:hypothetical protein
MVVKCLGYFLTVLILSVMVSVFMFIKHYDIYIPFIIILNLLLYWVMILYKQKLQCIKKSIIKFVIIYIIGNILSFISIIFAFFIHFDYIMSAF